MTRAVTRLGLVRKRMVLRQARFQLKSMPGNSSSLRTEPELSRKSRVRIMTKTVQKHWKMVKEGDAEQLKKSSGTKNKNIERGCKKGEFRIVEEKPARLRKWKTKLRKLIREWRGGRTGMLVILLVKAL